jgi:hypothetical protein
MAERQVEEMDRPEVVVEDRVSLERFITRAGEELGTWVRADFGLEVMCQGSDIVGTFHVRGQGHVLVSVVLPCRDWMSVPGIEGMEVWTDAGPTGDQFGTVHLRGSGDADWWLMRA